MVYHSFDILLGHTTVSRLGANRKTQYWMIWEAYTKFNWCRDLFSSHRGYKCMLYSSPASVLITTQRSKHLMIILELSSRIYTLSENYICLQLKFVNFCQHQDCLQWFFKLCLKLQLWVNLVNFQLKMSHWSPVSDEI